MARVFGLIAVLLLVPAPVLGQQTKSTKPIPGTTEEYAKIKNQGEVIGKLSNLDFAGSNNKSFSLDVPYLYNVAKNSKVARYTPTGSGARVTNYQSQLASLQRQFEQALAVKNPLQREQRLAQVTLRMQQLQAQMAAQQARLEQQMLTQAARVFGNASRNAPGVALGYKQFDMETIDKVVIRRANPPFEYDNKGNVKTHTKEELDRLRGKDKTLPGYEASALDLQAGQTIKVFLVRNPVKKAQKKDEDADEDDGPAAKGKKKAGDGLLNRDLPQVRMILIMAEATDADRGQDKTKKKRAQ
jgi:hypothetical protein